MRKNRLILLLVALALVAAACGGSTTEEPEAETPAETTATTVAAMEEEETPMEEPMALPGEGVSVTMARADWSTGYFQAAVYQQLLEELGYQVSDPADLELGPSLAYLSMAQGDFDFWVNSWYPGHRSWWEPELPDGTKVGDHLEIVGEEMIAGGLQGYLVTKSFADEFGITHLDQINDDPAILAAFDAADPVPGNGIADIYGCQESWTCDNIITEQIAVSGWENVQQVIAGYDAMVAEAIGKANNGEPMVIYTWTSSAYITEMRPGDNVVWLAVEEVIDGSNVSGQDGGEEYSQLPGTANIGPDQCPAAASGDCQLGWVAADIQVTGNKEFLDANPAAKELLAQVQLPIIDVSLANVEQSNGKDSNEDIQQLAADWIAANRATVDGWLNAAIAAAG